MIDNFGRQLVQPDQHTIWPPMAVLINPREGLNPNYGHLRVWENTASSIYHGLQVSVKKQAEPWITIQRQLHLQSFD